MKDLYYILGTDSNCSPDAISEAYRKLAKRFEPAYGEEDQFLESHFREISEAYEILSDPARRKVYDASIRKIHQKQLAAFKTRYLNVALTGSLILFTGLFGFYVVKSLTATHTQSITSVKAAAIDSVVNQQPIKHHKKRLHKTADPVITASKPEIVKKDTVKTTVAVAPVKPIAPEAPVKTIQPPVIAKTQVAAKPIAPVDSSYTTYLKPNLSGSIYLHQMADYMSAVVTVLPHNSLVKVLQKGPSFYKIAYNNQVGYLPRWMVVNP